jgi:hypothetical protein
MRFCPALSCNVSLGLISNITMIFANNLHRTAHVHLLHEVEENILLVKDGCGPDLSVNVWIDTNFREGTRLMTQADGRGWT